MTRSPSGVLLLIATLAALVLLSPANAAAQTGKPGPKQVRTDFFGDPLPEGALYRLGTVRLRHTCVARLFFAADGKSLLSASDTGELLLWDVDTGRAFKKYQWPKKGSLTQLAASADDRFLVGVLDSELVLLDKATGKHLASWPDARGWNSVAFAGDSKTLIALTRGGTVIRLDLASGKEVGRQTFDLVEWSSGWPPGILSPDGAVLAGILHHEANDHKKEIRVRFWDVVTGNECRPALTLPDVPADWHWLAEGRFFAAQFAHHGTRVWDTADGKEMRPGGPKNTKRRLLWGTVAFDPGGKVAVMEGIFGWVIFWDLATGKDRWYKDLPLHDLARGPWPKGSLATDLKGARISALAFSRDGKTLAVGTNCGHISLLDTATGAPVGGSRGHPGPFGKPLQFSPDGRMLLVEVGRDVALHDASNSKEIRRFPAEHAGWFPDSKHLFLQQSANNGGLRCVEAVTGKERWRLAMSCPQVTVGRDGKTLAAIEQKFVPVDGQPLFGGVDRELMIHLVDAVTGKEIKKFQPPTSSEDRYAVSPDLMVAVGPASDFKAIQCWDLATSKTLWTWSVPEEWGPYWFLQFLPGGLTLMLRNWNPESGDEDLTLLEVATGKKVYGRKNQQLGAASPDGRFIALQSKQATEVRELATGRLLMTVDRMQARTACWAFSPDGKVVAYNAGDYTVELREVLTGKLLTRLSREAHFIHEIAFAPDGRSLAVAYNDSTVLVWDTTGLAVTAGKLPLLPLTAAESESLWTDLASGDGPRIHRAVWTLVAGNDKTVTALGQRLRPAERPDPKQLATSLADLDSERFDKRDQAARQLEKMEGAREAVQQALAGKPSLEMRHRLEKILKKLDTLPWDEEIMRSLRAVQVLEQIGTPEALQVLEALAAGTPGAGLTKEARAALDRLKNRLRGAP
jgi:WD40 repeat protein